MNQFPGILPVREQSKLIGELVRARLDTILPAAMEKSDLDMWIILCMEDHLDPVYTTMLPMDCWCPILQMLIFVRERDGTVRRYNVSGTDTKDLYDRPYSGQIEDEQWKVLAELVRARDPLTIGIHTGEVKWIAGGLSHVLYRKLAKAIGATCESRLVSAERAAVHWSATLTDREIEIFRIVAEIAHSLIAACYAGDVITPGATSVDDLVWHYWQTATDRGLSPAFRPYFRIIRSEQEAGMWGGDDRIIRQGDVIHCDVHSRKM
jgi:hypothetical protein